MMAYTLRFDTSGNATAFNIAEQQKIRTALGLLETILAENLSNPKCKMIKNWFGRGNIKAVSEGLNNMHKYLTRRCTSLTFVSAPNHPQGFIGYVKPMVKTGLNPFDQSFENGNHHGHRHNDNAIHRINDNAPRHKQIVIPKQTAKTFRENCGYVNVQSGLRIYLTPAYFSGNFDQNDPNDELWFKFRCVAHELSHRILDTIDIAYGARASQRLALLAPDKNTPLNNADNWGLYLAEIYKFRNLKIRPELT
ncbi:M35 family metallo-endopeptidase [Hahella sp. CCB-MM4]|uniref:M35 family metallo-endopeptidase n=1 Tax=Hahella sp. (strain CCB-MM4) TaxID=1926491 RepID=UPI00143D7A15|nr:M35 family metallo-endopeptidase [Hahella sp. CCB-MM4]